MATYRAPLSNEIPYLTDLALQGKAIPPNDEQGVGWLIEEASPMTMGYDEPMGAYGEGGAGSYNPDPYGTGQIIGSETPIYSPQGVPQQFSTLQPWEVAQQQAIGAAANPLVLAGTAIGIPALAAGINAMVKNTQQQQALAAVGGNMDSGSMLAQVGTAVLGAVGTTLPAITGQKGTVIGGVIQQRHKGFIQIRTSAGRLIWIKTARKRRSRRQSFGSMGQMMKWAMMLRMMKAIGGH